MSTFTRRWRAMELRRRKARILSKVSAWHQWDVDNCFRRPGAWWGKQEEWEAFCAYRDDFVQEAQALDPHIEWNSMMGHFRKQSKTILSIQDWD